MTKSNSFDFLQQPSKTMTLWKAALYIRLSREDDGEKAESNSVAAQREILKEFTNCIRISM